MANLTDNACSRAEYGDGLIRITRNASLAGYDAALIQNAVRAIQRSRELLEATKYQVRPPADPVRRSNADDPKKPAP
jgi:hypothetical protein